MTEVTETPPYQQLLQMAGLLEPCAIRTAATLRIADQIADGYTNVGEIAHRTGTQQDVLEILLRYLADLGILSLTEGRGYALTTLGEPLRSESDYSLTEYLSMQSLSGRGDAALVGLAHTIRTGEPSHGAVFGRGYWESVNEDPQFSEAFPTTDSALERPLGLGSELVVDSYDWSEVDRVVDVGGHTGHMLIELLRKHPKLHGTVVDLKNVVHAAQRNFAKAGLTDRADAVVGSFFDPLPSGADVYLLSAILADWPEDQAVTILRRCAEAAHSGGKVLLAEVSLPAEAPQMQLWLRATMPAPVRSSAQLTALAQRAGLRPTWQGPETPVRSVLEFEPEPALFVETRESD